MLGTIVFCLLPFAVWCYLRWQGGKRLNHLSGPKGWPLVGNIFQLHPKPRLAFEKWRQQYGDVYRVRFVARDEVIVAGYDAIHEVLVNKGQQFSDRPSFFIREYLFHNTGSVHNSPNNTWKALRKTIHQHLRAYGGGIAELNDLISSIMQVMMEVFRENAGQPIDPAENIRLSALTTVACLVVGERLLRTDNMLHILNQVEKDIDHLFSHSSVSAVLIDMFPFVRHLPTNFNKHMKSTKEQMVSVWEELKLRQTHTSQSICKLLLDQIDPTGGKHTAIQHPTPGNASNSLTMTDAAATCIMLLVAGVATTAPTFTYLLYALAKYPTIQKRILSEVKIASNGPISLNHRECMPFTRAVTFEALRSLTPVPSGIMHCTKEDTSIRGFGHIPKGTSVRLCFWSLHHNKEFWGDPAVFRPDRFLDDDGGLLPADHPNRRHLMPFSAGPRVCAGEAFAMARLFLWTANLVQQFEIEESQNNIHNWTDASIHPEDSVMRPLPYKVIFTPRQ